MKLWRMCMGIWPRLTLILKARVTRRLRPMSIVMPHRRGQGWRVGIRLPDRRMPPGTAIRAGLATMIMEPVDPTIERPIAVMVLPVLIDAETDDADVVIWSDIRQIGAVAIAQEPDAGAGEPAPAAGVRDVAPRVAGHASVDRQLLATVDMADGGIIARRARAQRSGADRYPIGSRC